MTCSICHRVCIVVLTHTVRLGRRTITWTECRRCWLAEEARFAA